MRRSIAPVHVSHARSRAVAGVLSRDGSAALTKSKPEVPTKLRLAPGDDSRDEAGFTMYLTGEVAVVVGQYCCPMRPKRWLCEAHINESVRATKALNKGRLRPQPRTLPRFGIRMENIVRTRDR